MLEWTFRMLIGNFNVCPFKTFFSEAQEEAPDAKLMAGIPRNTGATMVVAGILPGIADYAESDSSTENESNSSDSEEDHIIMPSVFTQRLIHDVLKKLRDEGCG